MKQNAVNQNGGHSAISTKPNDETNKTKIQLSAMRPHYYIKRTKTQTNKRLHSMYMDKNTINVIQRSEKRRKRSENMVSRDQDE